MNLPSNKNAGNILTVEHGLPPWPSYDTEEIEAVTRVLRSGRVNYWTGDEGRAFEEEYATYCGVAHGLAVANGTAALELALYGLGIEPGDEVIVPARTFVATAAAVVLRGATPVIVDVDRDSQNLSLDAVAAALTTQTRAIIPVHLAGWPVNMPALMDFAHQHNLAVVEDCAQAHGAMIDNKPVGSFGDIGCFSFCQDKIITTGGEGGMLVTNDQAVFEKMWSRRDHGKDFELCRKAKDTPEFKWLVTAIGTNWRLTELQAAIGRLQLRKLPNWSRARQANAAILADTLSSCGAIEVSSPSSNINHAFYKFYAFIDPRALSANWSRDRICEALNAKHIPAGMGACPDVSEEQAFKSVLGSQAPHPNAQYIADRSIMLPVHPTLSSKDMQFIADTVCEIVSDATR